MLQIKPDLPSGLAQFSLLYSLAVRSVNLWTPALRKEIVETVEEAAAIEMGELKGRIWQDTYVEHVTELERMQQEYIGSPLPPANASETDPFGSLKDKLDFKKWVESEREKDF